MTDMFKQGAQFPPKDAVPRLVRYKRGAHAFHGNHHEIYERIAELIENTPHQSQLSKLYIAANVVPILAMKPADLLIGEPPIYNSGKPDISPEQKGLSRIVEENDLTTLQHEMVTAMAYRGDGWLKVRLDRRHDASALAELGLPDLQAIESIIESVDPSNVFPELSNTSGQTQFKAINVCWVETITETTSILRKEKERYILHVERHLPGYIVYRDFHLVAPTRRLIDGVFIDQFVIGDEIELENYVQVTGVQDFLIKHVPYAKSGDRWEGVSLTEQIDPLLSTINDTLTQISYVLAKHADPTMYGPDLDEIGETTRVGGRYIEVDKDDVAPGYMTWNAHLDLNFKLIDKLLAMIFQLAETPQWVFGTTLTADGGGTGTSHTDSSAIKARFFPLLSKVNRIRAQVDRALRDSLYHAQLLEQQQYRELGIDQYEVGYPEIAWRDGLPRDEKYDAEVASLRTNGLPTMSQPDAIKYLDGKSDEQAEATIQAIKGDSDRLKGTVDASIFNTPTPAIPQIDVPDENT